MNSYREKLTEKEGVKNSMGVNKNISLEKSGNLENLNIERSVKFSISVCKSVNLD